VKKATTSARILLVDDSEDDLEMYSSYLVQQGYEVLVAKDGEAAVEFALQKSFDIAVIDIGLPKLDGIGVMMVLRNYTKTRRIPLISLSARVGEEIRTAAVNAGANLAVEKPCPPEDLGSIIEVLLRRRK
jgi:DNA-binding response OmpR family regulator